MKWSAMIKKEKRINFHKNKMNEMKIDEREKS